MSYLASLCARAVALAGNYMDITLETTTTVGDQPTHPLLIRIHT